MAASKLQELQDAIVAGNIPQLVLSALSYAIESRSSDVHIEPEKNMIRMRFRIDGVLRRIVEYPPNIHPAVVSRVKIMSNLKIDEQRIPQDGRSQVTTPDGREMDLRISTLPTVNGEKVVMRLQDQSREIPDLPELGLEGNSLRFIEDSLKNPNGIILTTGPTGSGKTTTLYSALHRLNKPEVNILTIEDPVEIQMDGLNQSQVHPDIDYTFAFGLRTALRQDPDIIMVGEIRDRETIDVAIEASLTGHLVLSTIHTNSAVETLTRIDNMGVPPFLMTSTVNTIIAQRLVRKVCENCKEEIAIDEETMRMVKTAILKLPPSETSDDELTTNLTFYHGKGCDQCEGIGYKGRVGLYEVLQMNNELRRLILKRANALDVEQAAIESAGMVTLEQSGILKALKGETTLEEVYRVARSTGDDPPKPAPAPEPSPEPLPEPNPQQQ
ncbi:MAG: GspE/PulE family protein [Patescibacteria group bacterium]|nr:GspE/PulE family protein [Patescibacteria group bacterium]